MTDSVMTRPTRIGNIIVVAPWCTPSEAKNAGLDDLTGETERILIPLKVIPQLICELAKHWVEYAAKLDN